jgi:hypothetical protein
VLLAAGFWCLQSLQEEVEVEIQLPVKYKNAPADLILATDNPTTIVCKIKDKGLVLLSYSNWLHTFAPLEVNLKGLGREELTEVVVSTKVIESTVDKQLMASTELLALEPATFRVNYAKMLSKELPVQPALHLRPAPGFQLADSVAVSPSMVKVYATKNVLDSLMAITTEPAELKDVKNKQQLALALQIPPGVKCDEEEVTVTVDVEEFTEKRLVVPVICKDIPNNYTLRVFPASVTVLCNVPLSRFKELTEATLEIKVPFSKFEAQSKTGYIEVKLTKKPRWVSKAVLQPNVVEFILEQKITP